MMKDPTVDEISRVVLNLKTYKPVMEASGPHAVADCPWCRKKKHLYVNLQTGFWDCKSGECGESGGLWKLADQVGIKVRERSLVEHVTPSLVVPGLRRNKNASGVTLQKVQAACERVFTDDKHGVAVHEYLTKQRGFDEDTIRRFALGVSFMTTDRGQETAVAVPYIEGELVPLIKMRNLATDKKLRQFRRTKGAESKLFNGDAVKGCKRVVLVEGELDACSLWQLGVPHVASTSLGAKKDIPLEWLDTLAEAEDIVLFYDDDESGLDAMSGMVMKLGQHRCRIARIPDEISQRVEEVTGNAPKDANDLLRAGVTPEEVRQFLDAAKGIENDDIVRPSTFKGMLEAELNKGEASLGFPIRWPNLAALLKGVRGSEVTVITGHTAHGKTTWVTALAEMLAEDGLPTCVSSLENGALSVVRKLFQRKLGRPISSVVTQEQKDNAAAVLARLDENPLYVLNMRGRTKVEDIGDAFRFACKRYGVKAFVLDHLHYLAKDERVDPVQHLEKCMSYIVDLSRELDVHIFLVAHPNGSVEEHVIPTGQSIKGSSAIKQDMDNLISIWRPKDIVGRFNGRELNLRDPAGRKIKQEMASTNVLGWLWKVRHDDARTGMCLWDFDLRSLSYRSLDSTVKTEPTKDAVEPFASRSEGDNDSPPTTSADDPFIGLEEGTPQ